MSRYRNDLNLEIDFKKTFYEKKMLSYIYQFLLICSCFDMKTNEVSNPYGLILFICWMYSTDIFMKFYEIYTISVFMLIHLYIYTLNEYIYFGLVAYDIFFWKSKYNLIQIAKKIKMIDEKYIDQLRVMYPRSRNISVVVDKNKSKPAHAIYSYHPHGVFGSGVQHFFESNANFRYVIIHLYFLVPFLRSFLREYGYISNDKNSVLENIRKKRDIGIILGGLEELCLMDTFGKEQELYVKNRYGIFKYAYNNQYPMIPVYGVNERIQYNSYGWVKPLRMKLCEKFPYFPYAFFSGSLRVLFFMIPNKDAPVKLLIGKSVDPTKYHDASEFRDAYISELQGLLDIAEHQYQEKNVII